MNLKKNEKIYIYGMSRYKRKLKKHVLMNYHIFLKDLVIMKR